MVAMWMKKSRQVWAAWVGGWTSSMGGSVMAQWVRGSWDCRPDSAGKAR